MTKLIIISGTPGTGKSTLAKKVARKLGFQRIDLHDYYTEISTGYNRQKQCYDIDLKRLAQLVRKKKQDTPNGLVLDSHIAHLLPKRLVDVCIILQCTDLKKMEKRLKARKYPKTKIRENLDAEIFQVCLLEALELKHSIILRDTAQQFSLEKLVAEIKQFM